MRSAAGEYSGQPARSLYLAAVTLTPLGVLAACKPCKVTEFVKLRKKRRYTTSVVIKKVIDGIGALFFWPLYRLTLRSP